MPTPVVRARPQTSSVRVAHFGPGRNPHPAMGTDLVFTNELGKPINVSNLLPRSFRPLLKRAGLPRIRFHDLRHTAATLLLGQGVHPKIVSDMLGHSDIALTLRTYSHVTPTMQQRAADALESTLRRSSDDSASYVREQ